MRARRGARAAAQRRRTLVGAAVLATLALLASACSGGAEHDPRVLDAGPVDIKLPAGYKVEGKTIIAPSDAGAETTPTTAGATSASTLPGQTGTTPTTAKSSVPIKKSTNATEDLLAASGKFRDCLNDLGVKFIGRPDPSNPQSPTNDPDYIESLTTCAVRSNIIQALQAAQAEQNTLTPKQIKEQNEGYLLWRDCMVKRGWKIPKPTPDSKGRLFAFSADTDPPEPPPGKDFFNSKDLEQCSVKAQREYEKKHPGARLG